MTTVSTRRSSGVLLHPTSLPSPYGIGDLGPVAYAWVDFLAAAGQKLVANAALGPDRLRRFALSIACRRSPATTT